MPYTAQRWKKQEREVARLFMGERIPNNGFGQPDVITDELAIQVKTRITMPDWFTKAVDQSVADCGDRQHAVVFCHVTGNKRTRRFVVFDLDHVLQGETIATSTQDETEQGEEADEG